MLRDFEKLTVQRTNQPGDWHRLRIKGKHLRYVLENVLDAFGREVREQFYPQLELLQKILGDMHDASVLDHRLQTIATQVQSLPPALRERYGTALPVLQHQLRVEVSAGTRQFRLWLRNWRALRKTVNWRTVRSDEGSADTRIEHGHSE
jgi:hypothetical protein